VPSQSKGLLIRHRVVSAISFARAKSGVSEAADKLYLLAQHLRKQARCKGIKLCCPLATPFKFKHG